MPGSSLLHSTTKTRDSLNRRSRYKRQSSGRRLQIRTRDLDILSLLYRYRLLSSQDLIKRIEPQSPKRFTERLGQLYHDGGLVERPCEQWELTGANYAPIIYTLSPKGKRLLENTPLPLKAVVYPDRQKGGIRKQFLHTLKISQVISQAELETKQHPHQRFVPLEEIKNRQKAKKKPFKLEFPVTIPISKHNPHSVHRTMVRPDGLYGIAYTDTGKALYRFFAVEIDLTTPKTRSTLHHSSVLKKKLAYKAAIKSGSYREVLGVPCLEAEFFEEISDEICMIINYNPNF